MVDTSAVYREVVVVAVVSFAAAFGRLSHACGQVSFA